MPSESFYGAVGICGLVVIIIGIVFSVAVVDYEGTLTLRFIAPYLLTIGIMFFVALGVAGYFDLRPRFRQWNLKRKSRDIELEKQERELERKKREFETRYPKEDQTKSESSPTTAPYQKQTKDTPTPKGGALPKQSAKPMEIKHDQPILETEKPVPEKLKQNPENSERIVEKQANVHVAPAYTDEDFEHAISLSKHLQCLWDLFNAPSHSFPNRNRLIIAIKGSDSNRDPYYDAIDELVEKGLVYIGKEPYSDLIRSKGSVGITQTGINLIQRARKEKVTSWHDFLEKYLSDSRLAESTEKENLTEYVSQEKTTPLSKPAVVHLEMIILDYLRKNHSLLKDIESVKISHMELLDSMWKILGYYNYIDPMVKTWGTFKDKESDKFSSDNFIIIYNPLLDSIVNFVLGTPKKYSLDER